MDGFLNLLKPPGMTSSDVVQVVRRILKTKRVGHTGTLDPSAAGALVLTVGSATRLGEKIGRLGLAVQDARDVLPADALGGVQARAACPGWPPRAGAARARCGPTPPASSNRSVRPDVAFDYGAKTWPFPP